MGLFEKFRDTIFLKTDSEIERKVEVLTKLKEKYPDNDKISRDLFLANLGLRGEKEIEYELKNANIGMYVLHDITIKYEDLTAQIDYVVITPAKNYFIECKNLIGNITINERGDFRRNYQLYNHKVDEGIYSPLRQAERHIEIYKKNWNERHNTLDKIFFEKYVDKWNVPLVVMANPKNILNTRYAPKEIKNKVIKSDQLIKYLKEDLKTVEKSTLSSKKVMEKTANTFLEINQSINIDYEKIYLDNNNNLDLIKNKLIEFRTQKSKEKNIPAYYIFTNEELDKIIEKLPKNIEELKNIDILSDIKVKLHGEEIVKIINDNEEIK